MTKSACRGVFGATRPFFPDETTWRRLARPTPGMVRVSLLCLTVWMNGNRAIARADTGLSHYAASYYMGEHPLALHTLADLPPSLRQEVVVHLRARLGAAFFAQLRFSGGHRRDTSRRKEASVPGAVFYELNFSFSRPEAGIVEYVALLALGVDGSVVAEIDLPAFAGAADAHPIVSLERAKDLATRSGFSGPGVEVELDYSRERDCLFWRFRRYLGAGPGQINYRVLYVLMLDHPVEEIHDEYAVP